MPLHNPRDDIRILGRASNEPTGFPNRTDSTISFTDGATPTFTIAPTTTNFSFWQAGKKYTKKATENLVIADTEGLHYIYYDDGVLTSTANPTFSEQFIIVTLKVLVSIIYWDATNNTAVYVGEERHGITMDGDTHANLHFSVGLKWYSGVALNTISADGAGATADAQFGVDAGSIADEDIGLSPAAVVSTTGLPIYYRLGATGAWRKVIEAGFSITTTGGGNPAWNELTGGSWQLTEVGNNDYLLCHVFATTEKDKPIIAIMGQAVYGNINQAREGATTEINNILLGNLPGPEMKALASVIFQANSGYASAVNARVRTTDEGDDYIDFRASGTTRTAAGGDHGSLGGLADDDHPGHPWLTGRSGGQYLYGGTDSGDDLTLESTSDATKGDVLIQPNGGNAVFGGAATVLDTTLNVVGTDGTNSGSINLTNGTIPRFQILNYDEDNIGMFFDCYIDGVTTYSSDAGSNFSWNKRLDKLEFRGQVGVAVGDAITFRDIMVMDAGSGDVGIGITYPGARLHVAGDVTTSGDSRFCMRVDDDAAIAAGIGGGIAFGGNYTGTVKTYWAAIWSEKENATDGQYGGELHLGTRAHGTNAISSDIVINSGGAVAIEKGITLGDSLNAGEILNVNYFDGTAYSAANALTAGKLSTVIYNASNGADDFSGIRFSNNLSTLTESAICSIATSAGNAELAFVLDIAGAATEIVRMNSAGLEIEGDVTANQLISDVATGTSPLAVTSTTKVTNLNVDRLDNYHASEASTASTIAARNSSGDINARLFRSEYDSTNSSINYIMTQVDTVSNNYIRPSTRAQLRASLDADISRARAYASSTQSLSTTTTTKITLAAETYDNLGEFASSRFTATQAGYYLINGQVSMDVNTGKYINCYIYKNGAEVAYASNQPASGDRITTNCSTIQYLAVGNYIELYARHNYGSSRSTASGSSTTYLEVHRLS